MRDGETLRIDLPAGPSRVLADLRASGAEVVLVGGCVRDVVRGVEPIDWDVATSAPPEAVAALFPGSIWENRFGTVTVRDPDGGPSVEVTTYRSESAYRDQRRPEEVTWGTSLTDDLARRDFTINAMAWLPGDGATGTGTLVDPFGGAADLEAGVLRAVGDPDERFAEDALRLIRAGRFAGRLSLRLDPATEAAIRRGALAAATVSGERVQDELLRILGGASPSAAFELMERLGLLAVLLPELAALRGIPQRKPLPGDALDHSLRTADALPAADGVLRLAGLLHDVGKVTTLAEGHFLYHEVEGERLAGEVLERLRLPKADARRIGRLVRHHMFVYTSDWTDTAVRRFVRRVGTDLLPDLFALRAADDAASGIVDPEVGGWGELQRRALAATLDPLEPNQLAIGGDDLVAELGIAPGPAIGALLSGLLEAVLEDPSLNSRDRLLALARTMAAA